MYNKIMKTLYSLNYNNGSIMLEPLQYYTVRSINLTVKGNIVISTGPLKGHEIDLLPTGLCQLGKINNEESLLSDLIQQKQYDLYTGLLAFQSLGVTENDWNKLCKLLSQNNNR